MNQKVRGSWIEESEVQANGTNRQFNSIWEWYCIAVPNKKDLLSVEITGVIKREWKDKRDIEASTHIENIYHNNSKSKVSVKKFIL